MQLIHMVELEVQKWKGAGGTKIERPVKGMVRREEDLVIVFSCMKYFRKTKQCKQLSVSPEGFLYLSYFCSFLICVIIYLRNIY